MQSCSDDIFSQLLYVKFLVNIIIGAGYYTGMRIF